MWAMQFLRKRGFTPVLTPDIIRPAFAEAAGFRPRSEASQVYSIDVHELFSLFHSSLPGWSCPFPLTRVMTCA